MNSEKKNKEALERARALNDGKDVDVKAGTTICKYIFPELKESEDERIKNEIIAFVEQSIHRGGGTPIPQEQENKWLTWLEKQGEQKIDNSNTMFNACINALRNVGHSHLADWLEKQGEKDHCIGCSNDKGCVTCENGNLEEIKAEPKFKVGDWVVRKDEKPFCNGNKYVRITNIARKQYWFDSGSWLEAKDIRLWTIQDAKDGDVLVDVYGNIGIYKSHDDFDWTSYCSIGCNGGFQNFKVEHENENTYPATKEQCVLLFEKMKEAGYEWDVEKKELNKI